MAAIIHRAGRKFNVFRRLSLLKDPTGTAIMTRVPVEARLYPRVVMEPRKLANASRRQGCGDA
jgi:hypothetical protein